MKADIYTKIVLTLIAVCLMVLTVKSFFPYPTAVESGFPWPMDVNITGVSLSPFESIPVEVTNTIDVEVQNTYLNVLPW